MSETLWSFVQVTAICFSIAFFPLYILSLIRGYRSRRRYARWDDAFQKHLSASIAGKKPEGPVPRIEDF